QIEDAGKHLGSDADAVVPNAEYRLVAFLAESDLDDAAALRVLRRVREEGHDHLLEPRLVAFHVERRSREREVEVMSALFEERTRGVHRTPHDTGERQVLHAERDLSLRDPGDIEEDVGGARQGLRGR